MGPSQNSPASKARDSQPSDSALIDSGPKQSWSPKKPWHREPYVWMLLAIPGSAVAMGVVMLNLATSTYDGLVSDDYYKRGLQINRSIERDRYALDQGLRAEAKLVGATLTVEVSGNMDTPPATLDFSFLHATQQGRDVKIKLQRVADRTYVARIDSATQLAGNGTVRLETPTWRLNTRAENGLVSGQTVQLAPSV